MVRLIRTLIAAAPVAGFDETTLRSEPAGDKKYVHGAFTELYSAFWLGTRSLETMREAGIRPSLAGIVGVGDRVPPRPAPPQRGIDAAAGPLNAHSTSRPRLAGAQQSIFAPGAWLSVGARAGGR